MKISKTLASVSLVFMALTGSIFANGTPSKYSKEDLVWQEEFNGKKLNGKDWNFESHQPGWVNNELQSYGSSAKNTYLKDGFLVIQPIKTQNKNGTASYTSGRINTQGKHTFKYGRIEARLKVPKGQGYLPAFWMMPDDESFYGQWPKCGEIDIMEVLGHQTGKVYGTLHFGEPHSMQQGTFDLKDGNFAESFHEFAVEWEPGEIRFYCDGENYYTVNDWYTRKPGFEEITYPAPFDQPFYIILNVAVGGDWPGYPDESTSFGEEAQMLVDYVRVYQKKSYDENVEKPKAAENISETNGNMIKSGEKNWDFLTFEGAKGSVSVKGDSLDIIPLSDGPVNHALQLVQGPLALVRGNKYRLSFDASSDEDRTVISCISAPNNGWIRYLPDATLHLSKQKKHFSWDFNMLDFTDPAARLEFNCGNQNSLSQVHISNVRLEKIGKIDLVAEGLNVLPDGNLIHNGQFQEGKARLGNWTIENKNGSEAGVTNEGGRRELKVSSKNAANLSDVRVSQDNIALEAKKQYVLRFDAYAQKSGKIGIKFGDFDKTVEVGAKKQTFAFLHNEEKGGIYTLNLLLANNGSTVYVDNISLKENCSILNGNFSTGSTAWELYAHPNSEASWEVLETKGNKEAVITLNKSGNMDWMVQLKQNNILLEKGKKYHVSLRAKSDLPRTIMWALQRDGTKDDNWIPYSGTLKLDVAEDFKTFEHTFTMVNPTDSAVIFTISMGAVNDRQINKSHTITVDDVVIEEVSE